jgi:hypothetical protein
MKELLDFGAQLGRHLPPPKELLSLYRRKIRQLVKKIHRFAVHSTLRPPGHLRSATIILESLGHVRFGNSRKL